MLGKNRSYIYLHMRICLSAKCLKACTYLKYGAEKPDTYIVNWAKCVFFILQSLRPATSSLQSLRPATSSLQSLCPAACLAARDPSRLTAAFGRRLAGGGFQWQEISRPSTSASSELKHFKVCNSFNLDRDHLKICH